MVYYALCIEANEFIEIEHFHRLHFIDLSIG